MNKVKFSSILIISVICFLATLTSCSRANQKVSWNPDTEKFIESVSPIRIGRQSPIAISFTEEPKTKIENAISLSPKQKGEWQITEREAVFIPETSYPAGAELVLSVDCKKLFGADFKDNYYRHEFLVDYPNFKVTFNDVKLDKSGETFSVTGSLNTDIPEELSVIQEILTAKENGSKKSVEWKQSTEKKEWTFVIPVQNSEKAKKLEIDWSGKPLGLDNVQNKILKGSKTLNFPKKDDFEIIDINTNDKTAITVSFSKNLDESQDISSFISLKKNDALKNYSKYNSTISGNLLTIFDDAQWIGSTEVAFEEGIKSADGTTLARTTAMPLTGTWEKPCIEFANDGIIIPTTEKPIVTVKTKNLVGLLLQAYAIPNRNINQFLQVNELDEEREMYRVGEPVWEKKVFFEWKDSYKDTFINRGLDLSELVKKYPNGMFQIRVSFRHDQIMYNCTRGHQDFSKIPMPEDRITDTNESREKSYWDYYNDMDWELRRTFWYYDDDPCHPAYYLPNYNSRSLIKRNVLVSDLGLMAKCTATGKYHVTVADLKTAKPLKDINVELYSFTGKKLASSKTDANGCVNFDAEKSEKAFVITAQDKNQSSFLKISDGTQLSTSHFEVGGVKTENGVKGAIYGERGVWRPGDDIYLTFVLQDLNSTLPKEIPVLFTLQDPLGRVTDTQTFTKSENGFYAIKTQTQKEAGTGNWVAKVKIGGKQWTKELKVEEIIPNRLSINLETERKILKTDPTLFTITGAWLHGAPTANYEAEVSVLFTTLPNAFDNFTGYTFSNMSRSLKSSRQNVWSGRLNEDSRAAFSEKLWAGSDVPGMLNANFTTKLYEPSGAFSTNSKTIKFSPYSRYVGLKLPKGDAARNMLLTDVDHKADILLVDAEGNEIPSAEVKWKMYKLNWKWWWEKDAYSEATYVSSRYSSLIDDGKASIQSGRGSFTFKVKYPDWGRYLIEVNDEEGHSAAQIVYIDWPGWAGRAQENGSSSAAMVPLVTDKKQYTTGEVAKISFNANKNAQALITIEKSGEVLKQEWVPTNEGTTTYQLSLTEDMAPNIYAHVTLLQPHGQKENSLPIRLYGVVPVLVDNPNTKLTPVITTSKTFNPNQQATISVSEQNGKEMTYTLAVVDEGLLGITNFHSINLRNEFYKKEASLLKNWDLYKYVTNSFSGKLETLLAIGGSDSSGDDAKNNDNRFKPVVQFFGPFTIKAGEKKATKFTMPEYIGAVRIMVIAGNKGAYGTTEKTVPVKSDLMIQNTLPRTLGTNEIIQVPVTVFNNLEKEINATVRFKVTGAIEDSDLQTVTLAKNENKTILFQVKTKTEGIARFESSISADSSSAKAADSVEVKSRGFPVTYRTEFSVKPGATEKIKVSSPTEKSTTTLFAEISTYPQLSLESRLEYLTGYPHGCIEQITSGGFPQIYLPEYLKLSKEQVEKIKGNVNSVIQRYPNYQTPSGTFGYWQGEQQTSEWGTCYATHFMLEAKNHGYAVPDELLTPALKHLAKASTDWTRSNSTSAATQAYRLFVLSLGDRPNLGAMNRLLLEDDLSGETALLLAASYAQSGRAQSATDILKKYKFKNSDSRSTGGDFSSSLREQAVTLITYNLSGMRNEADRAAKKIAETLSSDRWLSTQETAWSLFALIPIYSKQAEIPAEYEITSNGKSVKNKISGGAIIEQLVAADSATQEVQVTNKGTKTIFGVLTTKGMSKAGTETAQNSGLQMTVSGLNWVTDKAQGSPVDISVQITNTSEKNLENLALTVPVPTGFEFTNERLASGTTSSAYRYQDIRDEAIYTYFDLKRGETVTFTFNATLAYPGNYIIPAIHVEAMYDNEISAISPGREVNFLK
ncbi:alpha-2-macroglobulin family protein [Treponema zioleckii]|uniref:alpha-2-macroglobulin family protein n=1 Tax=Treponema zioleckii TaxID=331680 RepID=UPI00168BB309|nr:MG2 domain-containing protein [Treponema zioleckii]